MQRLWWLYLLFPLLFVTIGFGSSRLTQSGNNNQWYKSLSRAPWTPPSAVFSIAWTILYVLLGIALAHIIATKLYETANGIASLTILCVLCVCIFAWPFVYFKGQSQVGGVALLAVIIALAIAVCALSGTAKRWLEVGCLLPLIVWGGFAMSLGVHSLVKTPSSV
jgi:tryptophan-rich sensory protein